MKGNIFVLLTLSAVLAGCQTGEQVDCVACTHASVAGGTPEMNSTNRFWGAEYDAERAAYRAMMENGKCCTQGVQGTALANGSVCASTPNGNDLMLETSRRVLHVEAQPNKKYDYYVWTGDKSYEQDPDLIVQDGVAAVLVEE